MQEVKKDLKEKFQSQEKGCEVDNIKNSFCIPFNLCLNDNKTFKNKEELQNIFKSMLKKY